MQDPFRRSTDQFEADKKIMEDALRPIFDKALNSPCAKLRRQQSYIDAMNAVLEADPELKQRVIEGAFYVMDREAGR